jgi:hypothetical protein
MPEPKKVSAKKDQMEILQLKKNLEIKMSLHRLNSRVKRTEEPVNLKTKKAVNPVRGIAQWYNTCLAMYEALCSISSTKKKKKAWNMRTMEKINI